MTKSKTTTVSDDFEGGPAIPYGRFAGVKPLITPPNIRRKRRRLIELLVDKLREYDFCVRAAAKGEISPSTLCDADYDLALTLNGLCYFDEEEGEIRGKHYDSQSVIHHYERGIARAKARRDRKAE